jgi:hypothetical protein
MNADVDHIPVPAEHRPNVAAYQAGQVGMTVQEERNEDGWLYCNLTVPVRQ